MSKTNSYLDYAATSPMSPTALVAYTEQLAHVGNASSLHSAGRAARRVVEESREQIAAAIGSRPSEVIFTAGGTEADNLAIKGGFWGRRKQDPTRTCLTISAAEHHAVLDPAFWLAEHAGAEIHLAPVTAEGSIDLDEFESLLSQHAATTAMASVMWANNEVGTITPVADAAAVAARYDVPLHSDAVQALGMVDIDFAESGLSMMTISGHKVGGPVGVGALVARRDAALTPVLHGGGQERGVRSGTVDTAAIRAFAVAIQEVVDTRIERAAAIAALRDELIERVQAAVPEAVLRGAKPSSDRRLAGNAHFTFPGCEGDSLLYLLDSAGVQCSTGSACQAGVPQPSHVLLAMGIAEAEARGALRFSLGSASTRADIDALIEVLPGVVERARRAGTSTT